MCAIGFGLAYILGRQVDALAPTDLAFRLKFWAGASLVYIAWVEEGALLLLVSSVGYPNGAGARSFGMAANGAT